MDKNIKEKMGPEEKEDLPPELSEFSSMWKAAEAVEEILSGYPTAKKELRSGVLRLINIAQAVYSNAKLGKYGQNPKKGKPEEMLGPKKSLEMRDASIQTTREKISETELLSENIWHREQWPEEAFNKVKITNGDFLISDANENRILFFIEDDEESKKTLENGWNTNPHR